MPPDSDEPGGGKDWLRHARSDLAMASAVGPVGDILAETLCFHAQQAAEKALKAVLVHGGIEFPRTHSLRLLVDTLPHAIRTDPGETEPVRGPSGARRIHPARAGCRQMGGKPSARLSSEHLPGLTAYCALLHLCLPLIQDPVR